VVATVPLQANFAAVDAVAVAVAVAADVAADVVVAVVVVASCSAAPSAETAHSPVGAAAPFRVGGSCAGSPHINTNAGLAAHRGSKDVHSVI